MEQFSIEQFVRDRDKALFSLDYKKIKKFCKKYNIETPNSDVTFWGGVHKSILEMESATMDKKKGSIKWLLDHGFERDLEGNRLSDLL